MTENEKAISILGHMKNLVTVRIFEEEALETAITALEEIQVYRAMEEKLNGISVEQVVNGFIAAVEKEICEGYERGRILTNEDADNWAAYKAIGTVEEVRDAYTRGYNQGSIDRADEVTQARTQAIDESIEASAKAICVGCGYLDGHKCTYKGANCGVSKPMLESVVKALEQMKGGE